jgi:SOS-response transcriptional repressor LexA
MTPRQTACLNYIDAYIRRTGGVSPSYAEISAHMNLASRSGAHRLVTALESLGRLRRHPDRARQLEVVKVETAPAKSVDADMAAMLQAYGSRRVAEAFNRQTGMAG